MKLKMLKLSALLLFVATAFISCDDDDNNNTTPQNTIVDVASANSDFSILVQALTRADLVSTLDGSGQFTVFAPTNDAFNRFLQANNFSSINAVPVATLKQVLLNHVIAGTVARSTNLTTGYVKTEATGSASSTSKISMFINTSGGVTINGGIDNGGAVVTTADVAASNGVIHIVNRVIALPTLVSHVKANPDFDTLETVLTTNAFGDQSAVAAALSTNTSPLTVFAPDNAAFTAATTGTGFAVGATAAQVTKVLQYHVTSGNVLSTQLSDNLPVPMITNPAQNITINVTGGARITDQAGNTSNITAVDIQAANGVIHKISRVLQPAL